jgi:hypothetical protein
MLGNSYDEDVSSIGDRHLNIVEEAITSSIFPELKLMTGDILTI